MNAVAEALKKGRRVRIAMPKADTLQDGHRLVRTLQQQAGCSLVYVQALGDCPFLLIWRATHQEAMREFETTHFSA